MSERLVAVLLAVAVLAVAAALLRAWSHRGARAAARREQQRRRVLLFTAPGCATCGVQARALADLADVVEHVDAAAEPARASAYRVLSVPTTVVVDDAGAVAAVHRGLVDAGVVRLALDASHA